MIIEKKIAANDVVSFRILTGEEIIGKCLELTEKSITVSRPIIAQMRMVSQTEAALQFAPYMATIDDGVTSKVKFNLDKLLSDPIKSRSDIQMQYTNMTTNLDIPPAGLF